MASRTKKYKIRKNLKDRKAGLDRKKESNRDGSTPSKEQFFGEAEKNPSES